MSHRYSEFRNLPAPSKNVASKGLAPPTRQQDQEQTRTRPNVSNYVDAEHRNQVKSRLEQFNRELMSQAESVTMKARQHESKDRHMEKPAKNVRIQNVTAPEWTSKSHYDKVVQEAIKHILAKYPNPHYEIDREAQGDTEHESDVSDVQESLVESFTETEIEQEGDTDWKMDSLKKNLQSITQSYLAKVQSKIDIVTSQMKIQSVIKSKPKQVTKPDKVTTPADTGAGDVKASEDYEVYRKMESLKQSCYRKIDSNLEMLNQIDNVVKPRK